MYSRQSLIIVLLAIASAVVVPYLSGFTNFQAEAKSPSGEREKNGIADRTTFGTGALGGNPGSGNTNNGPNSINGNGGDGGTSKNGVELLEEMGVQEIVLTA